MMKPDNLAMALDRFGRFVLWVSISTVLILAVLGALELARSSARAAGRLADFQQKAKADEEALAAGKLARLPFSSMGMFLRLLDGATGHVWFTNTSTRSGFVCIRGQAKSAKGSALSLAACTEVQPYSTVNLKLMFAGASIRNICPQSECDLAVEEAP